MSARITQAEYSALTQREKVSAARKNKYHARQAWRCAKCNCVLFGKPTDRDFCVACGCAGYIRFDSQAEARIWDQFFQLRKVGKIRDLHRQVAIPITINGITVGTYFADITCVENQKKRIVEVKGGKATDTDLSKLKRRCVEALYGVQIEVVRTGGRN